MIKGVESIAEYAIRRWMLNQEFTMSNFTLTMDGSKGLLTDKNGDKLTLVYDGRTGSVYAEGI